MIESSENNLQFDIMKSTILVKFTQKGDELLSALSLNGNGYLIPNEDGYYEIFTHVLFQLFACLLVSNANAKIEELVDGPILIPSVFLKEKTGNSVKHR